MMITKTASSWPRLFSLALVLVFASMLFMPTTPVAADGSYIPICTTPLAQDWSNTSLITTDNSWSGVPGIVGYRGEDLLLKGVNDTNPSTIVMSTSSTSPVVWANRSVLTGNTIAEYEIANPTIALKPSSSNPAPHLLLHIDTRGATGVNVSYLLRDIDNVQNDAVAQVALQYRVGETGNFTNIPAAYVADATTGYSQATQETPISVSLPAAALDKSQVQLRIIMAVADGMNEWVGVDDILIACDQPPGAPPTVSFQAAQGTVNESGWQGVVVELERPAGSSMDAPAVFDVAVSPQSTALTGVDFSLDQQSVTFDPSDADGATRTIRLSGIDDALLETNETIVLELRHASGPATLGDVATATYTLADDEQAVVEFVQTASTTAGEATPSAHAVDVRMTINATTGGTPAIAPGVTVPMTIAATPGSATDGTDYTFPFPTTLTFTDTTPLTQAVTLTIHDDALIEGDETVTLQLATLGGLLGRVSLGAQMAHSVTISDDDRATIHFEQASGATADETSRPYQVAVALSLTGTTADTPALAVPVGVSVSYRGGTALRDSDFTFTDAPQLSFTVGSVSGVTRALDIVIVDDAEVEGPETVELALSNASGPTTIGAPDVFTLTITDDDSATVSFAAASSNVPENGTHTVDVVLALPAGVTLANAVTVDVAITGGSATEGSDFTLGATQVMFDAGSGAATQSISLAITEDFAPEGDETIVLALQNPRGASGQISLGAPATHTVTIADDDGISIAFAADTTTVEIGDSHERFEVAIRLSMSGGSLDIPLTFSLRDMGNGTAVSWVDYGPVDPNPQTLSFPAGSSNGAEIRFPMIGLNSTAQNETRTINLALSIGSASFATVGSQSTHTVLLRYAPDGPVSPPPGGNPGGNPGNNPGDGGAGPAQPGGSNGGPAAPILTPQPAAVVPATTFICDNLSGQSGGALSGSGGFGNISHNGLTGNTFCTILAQNGQFARDPAEIGHAAVLEQPVVQAINVYGLLPGGASVVAFDQPVRICLAGTGDVLFLSAAEMTPTPMRLTPLPDSAPGSLCVAVANAGKVVLVGTGSALSGAPTETISAAPAGDCHVTTTHQVRLRATPDTADAANVITTLPYALTLTVTERAPGWYRVIYLDGQGWVSADYVTTNGKCE